MVHGRLVHDERDTGRGPVAARARAGGHAPPYSNSPCFPLASFFACLKFTGTASGCPIHEPLDRQELHPRFCLRGIGRLEPHQTPSENAPGEHSWPFPRRLPGAARRITQRRGGFSRKMKNA